MENLTEYLKGSKSLSDSLDHQPLAPTESEAYDYISISSDVAQTLLGDKYKSSSKYQLCVDTEETIVVEYDTQVPETDHRYRTEYVLASEDVESYNNMLQDMLIPHYKAPAHTAYDIYEHKKSHWWIFPVVFFSICLVIGVSILYFLMNFK